MSLFMWVWFYEWMVILWLILNWWTSLCGQNNLVPMAMHKVLKLNYLYQIQLYFEVRLVETRKFSISLDMKLKLTIQLRSEYSKLKIIEFDCPKSWSSATFHCFLNGQGNRWGFQKIKPQSYLGVTGALVSETLKVPRVFLWNLMNFDASEPHNHMT